MLPHCVTVEREREVDGVGARERKVVDIPLLGDVDGLRFASTSPTSHSMRICSSMDALTLNDAASMRLLRKRAVSKISHAWVALPAPPPFARMLPSPSPSPARSQREHTALAVVPAAGGALNAAVASFDCERGETERWRWR